MFFSMPGGLIWHKKTNATTALLMTYEVKDPEIDAKYPKLH